MRGRCRWPSTVSTTRRGAPSSARSSTCSPRCSASTPPTARQRDRLRPRPAGTTSLPTASTASCVGELPDRQNLVARLEGARPGPTLTLMGHMDVVPADAAEWSVPPFGGVVQGRLRVGLRRHRHEEPGGRRGGRRSPASSAPAPDFAGTDHLRRHGRRRGRRRTAACAGCAENHPDLLRCDYLLNEGMGGLWLPVDGRKVFLLAVGEKAFAQFRIRTRGPRRPRLRAREGAQRRDRPGARRRRRSASPTRRPSSRR